MLNVDLFWVVDCRFFFFFFCCIIGCWHITNCKGFRQCFWLIWSFLSHSENRSFISPPPAHFLLRDVHVPCSWQVEWRASDCSLGESSITVLWFIRQLHCHYNGFARLIFCLWWWTFGCIFFFFFFQEGVSLCQQINLDLTFKAKTFFYFWVVLLISVSILCQFQCYLVSFLI